MVCRIHSLNKREWDLTPLFVFLGNKYHIVLPLKQRQTITRSGTVLSYALTASEDKYGRIVLNIAVIGASTQYSTTSNLPSRKRVKENVNRLIATINNFKRSK